MKSINVWLDEYGESHKNSANKKIHWFCVPAIMFSFIGFLLMNFIFGFPIAAAIFINIFILFHNRKAYVSSICISAVLMVILWSLSSLLTLQFPNGLIGLFIDLPWWLGGQLN